MLHSSRFLVSLISFISSPLVSAAPASLVQREDGSCTPDKIKTRFDFNSMPPAERKAYTDAVKCLRYMDYAVIHVNRTQYVHLDAYFLTWHRYLLWLYENDLEQSCGYCGPFPYWNFAATASDPHSFPIFDGSEYSMSGDGAYNNTGPIVLGFVIDDSTWHRRRVLDGRSLRRSDCTPEIHRPKRTSQRHAPGRRLRLQRHLPHARPQRLRVTDLHKRSTTHCRRARDQRLELRVSAHGVIGSSSLGIHSGAHFSIGGQMDSIHVSAQDPIWYPLHTMIDHVYWSWQMNYPDRADQLNGTGTALNTPPSDLVTLDSVELNWGYFQLSPIQVRELISTTGGPFCYQYDVVIS